jgi:hypothetical protein
MKSVKFGVVFSEKAGRLELIIRFLWAIPSVIVLLFLLIAASFAWLFQFLYVLILGKKHSGLHEWIFKCLAYITKFHCYLWLLTDERNSIMPED